MGIGIWELVLLLLIAVVVFGTKRLRNIGGDLGSAIKSFRSAMNEPDETKARPPEAGDSADKKDQA